MLQKLLFSFLCKAGNTPGTQKVTLFQLRIHSIWKKQLPVPSFCGRQLLWKYVGILRTQHSFVGTCVLCLPVYNVCPCITDTPSSDCTLEKISRNRGKSYVKLANTIMLWIQFRKRWLNYVTQCTSNPQKHDSSHGFFWWSVTVKSWILSAIHCIQLLHYSRTLRSICEEFELSWCFLLLLSHFQSCELQRCHNISQGHHVIHSELHILVRFSPSFLAIMMF